MQETATTLSHSDWFILMSGIASVLGCLIAVYPVQIRGVEPSVYRGLIWQKTLLMALGIGITVSSAILVYNQQPLEPSSPFLVIDYMLRQNVYTAAGYTSMATYPNSNANDTSSVSSGVNTDSQSGGTNTGETQSGVANIGQVQSGPGPTINNGYAGPAVSNGQGSVTGPNSNNGQGGVTGPNANRGQTTVGGPNPYGRELYGSPFWWETLIGGGVLIFVGFIVKPFEITIRKLKALEEDMASNRESFVKELRRLESSEEEALVELYDRNASFTRAALFAMLTDYRLPLGPSTGSYLSTHDLHALASMMASTKSHPTVRNE